MSAASLIASLVGFGVVFVLVSWLGSAALVLALRRLVHGGAAVERRAAMLAAALPVLLGAAVTAILLIGSLMGRDHCLAHDHHAHLCLQHGAVWAERSWALVLVAAWLAKALLGGSALMRALLRGRRLWRELRSPPRLALARRGEPVVVPSERPFSFVIGLRRPVIVVSTAARALLDDEEWRAMLAHERGHITGRDLGARLRLELLLLFAAPFAAAAVRERWELATERLRDSDAAEQESPEAVASALVRMVRASLPLPAAAFAPQATTELARRVTALLDGAPRGDLEARRISRLSLWASAAVTAAAVALAHPLHHALETLLG